MWLTAAIVAAGALFALWTYRQVAALQGRDRVVLLATRVGLFAGNRLVDEGYMKEAIELVKKGLGETKDIPIDHVFNFSFFKMALR